MFECSQHTLFSDTWVHWFLILFGSRTILIISGKWWTDSPRKTHMQNDIEVLHKFQKLRYLPPSENPCCIDSHLIDTGRMEASARLNTVLMTANGPSRWEGWAWMWRWVSGHCRASFITSGLPLSGFITSGLPLSCISTPHLYSHSPLAVCKPFSLLNRSKAQHARVKKETFCFPSEAHWFLNLGKRVMLPHGQAEFPMATESRIAGNQFNSWHQNAFPYVKLS